MATRLPPLGEIPARLRGIILRSPPDSTVHTTPQIDRKFRFNGNVLEIARLKGSFSVDTRVDHLTLDKPIPVGRRGNRVYTNEIVVKYLPDDPDTPPARESVLAMEREAQPYKNPRQDALGEWMVPGTVKRVRNSHGQRVPVVIMPFIDGTRSLRKLLNDPDFNVDYAVAIQGETLDRTVSAIARNRIRTPRMRQKMELVSMKRLERDRIWQDMEEAITAVEGFFPDNIPTGKFREAELMFAEKNEAGENTWVSYGSLNQLQQRAGNFLSQEPFIEAEGIDHDTSMKNAEVFVDTIPHADTQTTVAVVDTPIANMENAEVTAYRIPDYVRLDKGYRARRRNFFARLFRRPGEVVDAAEAIFYAGKAVSLETLQGLGDVNVEYKETDDGKGQLFIDATALEFSKNAQDFEARMKERLPGIATKLGFPRLTQHLKGWQGISDFYEFVYARKRVVETIGEGEERPELFDEEGKRPRADTGLLMLQRMGQAFREYDSLEAQFAASQPPNGRRADRAETMAS